MEKQGEMEGVENERESRKREADGKRNGESTEKSGCMDRGRRSRRRMERRRRRNSSSSG